MVNSWDTAGVVHLRDLVERYRWDMRKLPAYLDRLGQKVGGLETSSFFPPRNLIVLNRAEDVDLWQRFRCWLSRADQLHLVLCHHEPSSQETRDAQAHETHETLSGLSVVRLLHWTKGAQAPEPLRWILEGSPTTMPSPGSLPAGEEAFRPGPWIEVPTHRFDDPELMWPRWCCRWRGSPALYYPGKGSFLDLLSGAWGDPVAPISENRFVAAWPDGSRLLSSNYAGDYSVLNLESRGLKLFKGPRGAPIGIWPGGQVGWTGHRCTFSWLALRDGDGGTLSACDHDWPCGHVKKQYGFLDNEPCWVHLSPIADCYLSVYQKDAVVSQALPVGWRLFGNAWAAVSEPSVDPSRALFFTNDGGDERGDPRDAEDGDARQWRPTIALGPDPAFRYALDLRRPTYRIVGDVVTLVNESLDGYAVFDAAHQPVRYGTGRLLGGWGRWLTGWHDGRLWREDIVSGDRLDLGPEEETISWAFSLPASANLVLVSQQETRHRVRLV
jgi:hypothetical protein